MKKFIGLLAVLVFALAFGTVAMANPGQNPNRNPGSPEAVSGGVTITVTGGGNNLVIRAICNTTGEVAIIPRAGNGTFRQSFEIFGYAVCIQVQGNSLRNVTSVALYVPYVPTVVRVYDFYQWLRNDQIESRFVGTTETFREFVGGTAVKDNWVRGNQNDFPGYGFTGQAVRTGASVTGTLNYQYVRDYVEQFNQVYVWVDVTVWSNGARYEAVREGSEHVRGVVDGDGYSSAPFSGSRAVAASGGSVVLHMGYQGGVYGRYATISVGNFTVDLVLRNTGNPPTITATIADYDLAAL